MLALGAGALAAAAVGCDDASEDSGANPTDDAGAADGTGGAGGSGGGGSSGGGGPGGQADAGGEPDAAAQAPDPAEGTTEDLELFLTAVIAGSMTDTSAIICGQVADGAPATLRLWDEATQEVVREVELTPTEGRFKTTIEGLTAATRYRFAFFRDDVRSQLGGFRTAAAPGDLSPVTFGATACTNHALRPYTSLVVAAGEEMDAFCHLGDFSYNDGAETHAEYHERWTRQLADDGYRALFARAGLYATWDDHEIGNGDWDQFPPAQREAGIAAWHEALPVPGDGSEPIWRTFRWGDAVELFVLDCRNERRPETIDTDEPIYISPEQMEWLKSTLSASTAHFKVVLNSVPITWFPPPIWVLQQDRWQGYAAQRAELLDYIVDEDIRNVWFLSGDFHMGLVAHVEAEGARRRMYEILCGPGAGIPKNPAAALAERDDASRDLVYPPETAQFLYSSIRDSATLITFDPTDDTVRVRFIDGETEEVLYDEVLTEGE